MILTFDPSRYGRSVLTIPQTEAQVQAACLAELERRGIPAWHLDAGGTKTRKVRGLTGPGGQADIPAGWPDIVGILPGGRVLFCEVKRPGVWIGRKRVQAPGAPTKEQTAFLERAEAAGALCLVAWSLSDLTAHLDHPMNRPGLPLEDRAAWAKSEPRIPTAEAREEKRAELEGQKKVS